MAAWIKMSRGMKLGLGPGDFVLWGLRSAKGATICIGAGRTVLQMVAQKRGTAQIFGLCVLWPNGGWIRMPLGREVGLGTAGVTQ